MLSRPAVLITGSAARIGAGLTLGFAQKGYDVAIHYNRSKFAAENVAEKARRHGVRVSTFQADLTEAAEVEGLMQSARNAFPALRILINNASVYEPGTLQETSTKQLEESLALHVTAPYILIRDFAKSKPENGLIINVTDVQVRLGAPTHLAYWLAKQGLHSLTLAAATELAPAIRVNAIAPGYILDPLGKTLSPEEASAVLAKTQSKEKGRIEDVFNAAWYFETHPEITGKILEVA